MKLYLAIALAFASISASAEPLPANIIPNESINGASSACHETKPGDTRLNWGAVLTRNMSNENVGIACSPNIDARNNGATSFGAVLSNMSGVTRTVTCTAVIMDGGKGPKQIPRYMILNPNTIGARISWNAAEIGRSTFNGGQAGFVCTLPPGTGIQWIYAVGQAN